MAAQPKSIRRITDAWPHADERLGRMFAAERVTPERLLALLVAIAALVEAHDTHQKPIPPSIVRDAALECIWAIQVFPSGTKPSYDACSCLRSLAARWPKTMRFALQSADAELALTAYDAGMVLDGAFELIVRHVNAASENPMRDLMHTFLVVHEPGEPSEIVGAIAREPCNHASEALSGLRLPDEDARIASEFMLFSESLARVSRGMQRHFALELLDDVRCAIAASLCENVVEYLNETTKKTAGGRACAEKFVTSCIDELMASPELRAKFMDDVRGAFAQVALESTSLLEDGDFMEQAPRILPRAQPAVDPKKMDLIERFAAGEIPTRKLMEDLSEV